MSEENKEPEDKQFKVPLDPSVKKLNVVIDQSEIVKQKDKEISKLNETIGALLAQEKAKFFEPKPAPSGKAGIDTAPLNAPTIYENVDLENSNVLDFLKFKDAESAIEHLKNVASDPSNPDYKEANQLLDKAVKKLVKNSTWEFSGSVAPWKMQNGRVIKVREPNRTNVLGQGAKLIAENAKGSFKKVNENE